MLGKHVVVVLLQVNEKQAARPFLPLAPSRGYMMVNESMLNPDFGCQKGPLLEVQQSEQLDFGAIPQVDPSSMGSY